MQQQRTENINVGLGSDIKKARDSGLFYECLEA